MKTELPPIPVLRETRWTFDLPITGHSMEPLLRAGDAVTVACCPVEEVRPGDLICFRRAGDMVLHRLVEMRTDRWYEKGDAEEGGQWIRPDDVLGKASLINGRPLDAARQVSALRLARFERRLRNALPRIRYPRFCRALWRKWKARRL